MCRKRRKTKHHRKCVKNGGQNDPRNISLIPSKHHEAYHLIFGHMTPEKLASELNRKYIDPDYRMVAVHRERGLTVEQVLSFREVNDM